MKYFSMFSGIGGFEIPLQELNFKCVGFSEIDKYAVSIYQKHFPTHHNFGDTTKIIPSDLPDFDLLCGGFPCQAFSVAGKRQGFDDTRGTLFFDIARILREKNPRLLLLENVKGLLSHDSGRTFKILIATLTELGYDCQWQVLNAKDFGVPQNRERVFIVGHLRGTPQPEIFPLTGETAGNNGATCSTALDANYWKGIDKRARYGTGGDNVPYVFDMKSIGSTTRRGVLKKGYIGALDTDSFLAVNGIRRLTPLECERLMGFPDGWTEGVSDTQRYKCLGNGVVVNVVRAVMMRVSVVEPPEEGITQ